MEAAAKGASSTYGTVTSTLLAEGEAFEYIDIATKVLSI